MVASTRNDPTGVFVAESSAVAAAAGLVWINPNDPCIWSFWSQTDGTPLSACRLPLTCSTCHARTLSGSSKKEPPHSAVWATVAVSGSPTSSPTGVARNWNASRYLTHSQPRLSRGRERRIRLSSGEEIVRLVRAALDHRIPVTRRLRTEHPNSPSNYLDPLTENCPQKRGNST